MRISGLGPMRGSRSWRASISIIPDLRLEKDFWMMDIREKGWRIPETCRKKKRAYDCQEYRFSWMLKTDE